MKITFQGFFGDGDHTFALTDPIIAELEQLTDKGIGSIYQRAIKMEFQASDLTAIIRLGLIGGGMAPERAARLVATYADNRPLSETYPLALDILDARWNGTPDDKPEEAAQ